MHVSFIKNPVGDLYRVIFIFLLLICSTLLNDKNLLHIAIVLRRFWSFLLITGFFFGLLYLVPETKEIVVIMFFVKREIPTKIKEMIDE